MKEVGDMSAILETGRGKITYSDDYIATIAGMATTECYGVVGMASRKVTDGFSELLGRDNLKRGVKIISDQTNAVRIDLYIVVQYGLTIGAASTNIIDTVRYQVEKTTGLVVRDVNIVVSGIRVDK